MPPIHSLRGTLPSLACAFLRLRLAAFATIAAFLLSPTAADAYEFLLASPGGDQHLNWRWEVGYPSHSCQSWTQPCGDLPTVNGSVYDSYRYTFVQFPPSPSQSLSFNTGGGLTWTGDDSLKVSATTAVNATASTGYNVFPPGMGYSFDWAAVNARDVPMQFQLLPEAGDPFTTSLKITPQIVGSFVHVTANGGVARVMVQMEMAVSVNGTQVTRDSLYAEWEYANGASGTRLPAFPKGGLNTVMVPNVTIGSQMVVRLWAYAQVYCETSGANNSNAQVTGSGPVGLGPSIVVLVQPMGVTAVGDPPASAVLALSALPNPSAGTTRIHYSLPRSSRVVLSVHDVTGRRVATLTDREESAGAHDVAWSGFDGAGAPLPAGVYLLRVVAGRDQRSVKIARTDRAGTR